MFDERHLQLTSAYAYSSKYFIRTVIYPLAKYIDKYLQQKAKDSINKKLYWETGKQTYAMSPDGNGGWKWSKYDPKSNEFVSTSDTEEQVAASTLADSISGDVTKTTANESVAQNTTEDFVIVAPSIIAETEQANFVAKSQGLKIQTENQTVVTHRKTDGNIGFSVIDEKTNKIVADENFILEFQADINKYLAECFNTLGLNHEAIKSYLGKAPSQFEQHLAEVLAKAFSSGTIAQMNLLDVSPSDRRGRGEGGREQGEQALLLERGAEYNLHSKLSPLLPAPCSPASFEQLNSPVISNVPAPEHINPQHWQELVVGSAIAPGIASMNFESLHFNQARGVHEAWDLLMSSDKIPRTNTGRISGGILKVYSFLDNTDGWWCNAGVDPRHFHSLTPNETANPKEWGCYKPDQPRPKTEKKDGQTVVVPGKFTKYEHPLGTEKSIFLLDVPDDIAQSIYQKAGVNPSDSDLTSGFWYCVWKHNIPVTITEGAKKAASLLSQGHAAIGLAGINGGYYCDFTPCVTKF
ncbi:DUF3854 domain-containing protein [Nostoc sp. MS1]|uniref:DUF3854 domain-containing protein n=1 Tax=Nostoc sp. MS1 TaxID=2764711 RepID=UPI001CC7CE6D|nr:DUF3854 domain-containing protein [Nostoc sp. MS1]